MIYSITIWFIVISTEKFDLLFDYILQLRFWVRFNRIFGCHLIDIILSQIFCDIYYGLHLRDGVSFRNILT